MTGQATNQSANSASSQLQGFQFMIRGLIGQACHLGIARVIAVSNAGGVSPVGTVDVLPLVNQIDGAGNAIPYTTVHSLPYFRLQGGGNAIILDPQIGDIGVVAIADRDITNVKQTLDQANPGSARRFNWADGLYFGGFLNGIPTQYTEYSTAGIKIHSPTAIILDAPDVQINAHTVEINASTSFTVTSPTIALQGVVSGNSTAAFTGEVSANGGHTVSQHTHTQGPDSRGDTEQATNKPTG